MVRITGTLAEMSIRATSNMILQEYFRNDILYVSRLSNRVLEVQIKVEVKFLVVFLHAHFWRNVDSTYTFKHFVDH
jgi:hypothetical protein